MATKKDNSKVKPSKATIKKPATVKKADNKPITEVMKKSEIIAHLSESAELSKKQISTVLEALSHLIGCTLSKKGAGEFTLPGLLKIQGIQKPAIKAHKGINPFTKEEMMFKAKPARTVVKIRPLKKLKEMVE